MAQFTAENKAALAALAKQPFHKQAKQFLNAYWVRDMKLESDPAACERIWQFATKFGNLEKRHGKEGCELDEFEAHQFLEKEVGAMTVKDMRAALTEVDLDFNLKMSLLEFLIFHHKIKDWSFVATWTPSGSVAHRRMLQNVQNQMTMAQEALALATAAADASKVDAANAAAAADASAQAAAASEQAAEEQHDATVELEAQEKAKADAIATEETKAADETLSTVKRNKAKAQLAILKSEDAQPLRRARITQEAAERKARKAAKAALAAATDAAIAKQRAEKASAAAEKAMEEADKEVEALTDQLEEAKAACSGSGLEDGTIWWLDREFEECVSIFVVGLTTARRSLKFMGPKQRAKAEAARAASRDRACLSAD